MAFEIIKTDLPEVLLLKPCVFEDARGFFFEPFNKRDWVNATGIDCDFVQDNHSSSTRGVLRGLHYQLPPAAQAKLVRVVVGEIYDIAVDIRRSSSTYGKWVGHRLSAENKLQMWLPEGFAHGFMVLSETAEFLYKVTDYYAPQQERTIRWDDPELKIEWPDGIVPTLSAKDADAPSLHNTELFP
jgi:dTDP-4-dehydrorhamnose 3,5-epimerase